MLPQNKHNKSGRELLDSLKQYLRALSVAMKHEEFRDDAMKVISEFCDTFDCTLFVVPKDDSVERAVISTSINALEELFQVLLNDEEDKYLEKIRNAINQLIILENHIKNERRNSYGYSEN